MSRTSGSVVTAHYPELDADPDKGYTWNLATGSGATRYAGLDTFDRTLACLWQDGTPDDVVNLAYEYDRASNRINREDHVSKNLGTAVYRDELYEYDGLDRLVDVQRGELSGGSITGLNFRQNWQDPSTDDTALDPTGNWADFRQDTTGNTTFDLTQTRTHNAENEITDITATGGSWVDPLHDAVGNTTTIPRPPAPSQNYLLTFDAWNRVVKIKTVSGSLFSIGDYSYDGLHRRVTRDRYVSNEIDFSRRMYYTDQWQVLEERQEDDSEWLLNKQYVWGIRYIDELVLRDQDTSNPPNGTLNQRHYALQDANFNVVALINTNGSVGRRYSYDAYGHSTTLEADYSLGAYEYDFEYRYAGYRWDYETHLLQVRNRWYHPRLGRWLSRDPVESSLNLFTYCGNQPVSCLDPSGLESVDGRVWGWGTVHADLNAMPQGFRIELVDVNGTAPFAFWGTKNVGGRPAGVFATNQINQFVNQMTGSLQFGFSWRFLVVSGAAFSATFKKTSAVNGNGKCPYWVQYATVTETKEGAQQTTSWFLDKPAMDENYPNRYLYSTLQGNIVTANDFPGRTYELNEQKNITHTNARDQAGNPLTVFKLNPDPLKGNTQYRQDLQSKYSLNMQFQTYLVDPDSYLPIGYLSWGYTVSAKAAGPSPTVTNLKWNAGMDPTVWKEKPRNLKNTWK